MYIKIKNEKVPFWAWRTRPFRIVQAVAASTKGIEADYIVYAVGYGETFNIIKPNELKKIPYSTFAKNYMAINSINQEAKRRLVKSILFKIKS